MSDESSGGGGMGFFGLVGCVLAAIASWMHNGSILWAVLHGFFGWFYIAYLCGGCGGGLPEGLPW